MDTPDSLLLGTDGRQNTTLLLPQLCKLGLKCGYLRLRENVDNPINAASITTIS